VKELLREYQEIFTNVPKVTKLGEHQITLTTVSLLEEKLIHCHMQ